MARKGDHVRFRNEKLFCQHCGGEQTLPLPMAIPVFTAMTKAFTKLHLNCEKTWVEPTINQDLSESQKAMFWLERGERGVSSETMYSAITGRNICRHRMDHPYDPDDFRRCYLLLKAVPEWRNKLDKVAALSTPWKNLVDNWDKLTEMLEEQMLTKKANGMYQFMQTLIEVPKHQTV